MAREYALESVADINDEVYAGLDRRYRQLLRQQMNERIDQHQRFNGDDQSSFFDVENANEDDDEQNSEEYE